MNRIVLNKLFSNRITSNIKLFIIVILFFTSLLYALSSTIGYVYKYEYSHSFSYKSLRLDISKKYHFVNEFKISTNLNDIFIPIGNLNLPDSLCTLYYDKEWKLSLTNKLRTTHKDNRTETIMFPFCRFP